MKNIHILPTDKPSRLQLTQEGVYYLLDNIGFYGTSKPQHIYITSDEEIKEGDWIYDTYVKKVIICVGELFLIKHTKQYKKIILTTDQDLIKDGVQSIDDEFLEWFVKNPSCEEVEVESWTIDKEWDKVHTQFNPIYPQKTKYKIIIPKEEPTMVDKLKEYFNNTTKEQIKKDWDETCKQTEEIISPTIDEFLKAQEQFNKQETLEEVAERIFKTYSNNTSLAEGHYDYMMDKEDFKEASLEITKWQQKRMYSEEDMIEFHKWAFQQVRIKESDLTTKELLQLWKQQQPKTLYYE